MTDEVTASSGQPSRQGSPGVAIIIPCLNESQTIEKVVADFRAQLPEARIVVVDNGSDDDTAARARGAGAEVIFEGRAGKGFALLAGFVVARDSDYLVMVDGDDTYPADVVLKLLAAAENADMVVATRLQGHGDRAFPMGHGLGNWLFLVLVRALVGLKTADLFSGYRVVHRRLLDAAPLIAQGFEIEAELSLQANARGFRIAEVPITYRARPEGSTSKLRTVRDGTRILLAILTFFRDYRPLTFFGMLSMGALGVSLTGGAVVVAEYLRTGLVPRLPLAVLSMGAFLLSTLFFAVGVLLSSINRRSAELAAMITWRRD
jgi:glycosyltransferase involved in cell wall biosynthesis